jgi:hypothetical protein
MKETLRKKPVRISFYLLGILIILLFVGRWFVQYHTKDLIEELIARESNGRVNLKLGKIRLAIYPQAQIHLHDTRVELMDSASRLPAYTVQVKYIGLQLQSLSSFLFRRQLLVDYFLAEKPEVSIYPHVKPKKRQVNAIVHVELGNIFMALQRVAQGMRVQKLGIFDGKLHLGSPRPDDKPVDLMGIDFQLDEFEMSAAPDGSHNQSLQVKKLKLRTGRQDITFPNGDFRMKYASLEINSSDNSVRIDSFFLSGMNRDTAYGSIEAGFRNLRLVNIDFRALYEQDLLKVDSLYCEDPDLFLNLDITARKTSRPNPEKRRIRTTRGIVEVPATETRTVRDTRVEKRIADLLGKLDIGYLGLMNADIRINTKNGTRYTPFATRGNNFEAVGISIDGEKATPIEIGNLVFAIKNYKASTADSLYDFFFDSVAYRTGVLSLKNLRIEPSLKNRQPDKKFLSIPDFELRDISISELVSNKRFKARELVVRNSRTINYFIPKAQSPRAPRPIYQIIEEISKSVDLQRVRLENAYLLNQSVSNKEQKIIVSGINSDISANQLLHAPSYELMGYSIGYLRFNSAQIISGPYDLRLSEGEILGREQRISARRLLLVNHHNRTSIDLEDALIRNYHFDNEFERVNIDSIRWRNARVTFEPGQPAKKPGAVDTPGEISLILGHIQAENTILQYLAGDTINAEVVIASMMVNGLAKDDQGNYTLSDGSLKGRHVRFSAPGLHAATGAFTIQESRPSHFEDINLEYLKPGDTIKATIPLLEFEPRIATMLEKKYPVLHRISLLRPVIFASLQSHVTESSSGKGKGLSANIGNVAIHEADINMYRRKGNKSIRFRTKELNLQAGQLMKDIGEARFSVGHSAVSTRRMDVSINDSISLMMDEGKLDLELNHARMGRGKDSGSFSALLQNIEVRQLSLLMLSKKGKAPLELNRFSVGGKDLKLDSIDKGHLTRQLKANPSLYVKDINLLKTTATAEISGFGIGYRNGGRIVFADSFRYLPLISRDSFSNTLQWQKVFLDKIGTGRITIYDFDIERLVTDTSIHIRKVEINHPYASIYKDKRVPFNFSTIKPLPTDMLKRTGQRVRIDTILLENAGLKYQEFNDKTKRIGSVHFRDMKALIRNATTYNHKPLDSLYLLTTAVMEDSVRLRVHVDQSYADTLSAFYMSVRVAPFNLTALNPMLGPLASAQVTSGYLDTLQMRVIAREYIAHGKMKLYYRDLKVNILDKENQQRKTLVTRLMNFAANLLIDRKNAQKTGTVFKERIRERGFLNYWIGITLNGALTNTGIRKNTKVEKKYRKTLKKDHVPEIPDVDL